MKCSKCGTDNQAGALFCRNCGTQLNLRPASGTRILQDKRDWATVLFRISFIVALYCLASLLFPTESTNSFAFGDYYREWTHYEDPLGINGDGSSYFMEWGIALAISAVASLIFYKLRYKTM